VFTKTELDKIFKDAKKGNKLYPADFRVQASFAAVPESRTQKAELVGLSQFQQFLVCNEEDPTAAFGSRNMTRVLKYYKDAASKKEAKQELKAHATHTSPGRKLALQTHLTSAPPAPPGALQAQQQAEPGQQQAEPGQQQALATALAMQARDQVEV
jgi:hypothetical protein